VILGSPDVAPSRKRRASKRNTLTIDGGIDQYPDGSE